ncbi:adenylate kinase-domain-containing protein [Xylaria arbuscula]|nr:adenylate kinase-domain-containing protein [Xylaria arbuscula]
MSSSEPETGKFAVIGVLGGPGSGKGTQCRLLAQMFKLEHISIGDVLRKELKREGSAYAPIIEENMRAGTVGPKEITVAILKSHILEASREGINLFVLDGFPRNLEQAQFFEEIVAPIEFLIVLECPDAVLIDRLLPRERFDDNLENINKRIRTFRTTTSQVIDFFRMRGKVKTVDADNTIDVVHQQLVEILKSRQGGLEDAGRRETPE